MKKISYFLDTTIFLEALISKDSKRARECRLLLRRISSEGYIEAWTSSLVIAEVELICERVYHLERKEIDETVRGILGMRNVKIVQRVNIHGALELYERYKTTFIDALVVSNALLISEHPCIISYDKDFDKMGIRRVEPKDVIGIAAVRPKKRPTS